MPAKCLVISDRDSDAELGKYLASTQRFEFHKETRTSELRGFLIDHPQTVVFWDGDDRTSAEAVAQILLEFVSPMRVFVITDNPINTYPYLFKFPAFSHHLYRRYQAPAPALFGKLAMAALSPHPFGVENYFSGAPEMQKIQIKRSSHKNPAVEAIQNYFIKQNVVARLAALVAQATDELIMNAIFDAPINEKGATYRLNEPRDSDFELFDREIVEVSVVSNADYIGVSVTDQFGSLQKDTLLGFLRKDYHGQAYMVRQSDPGAGLGLNGTIQSGLSLLFVCKPKVRTEVMIFFPTTRSYREFREGFRFLSIMAE